MLTHEEKLKLLKGNDGFTAFEYSSGSDKEGGYTETTKYRIDNGKLLIQEYMKHDGKPGELGEVREASGVELAVFIWMNGSRLNADCLDEKEEINFSI